MYIDADSLLIIIYGVPSLLIYIAMFATLLSIRKTLHRSVTLIYLIAAVVNFVTIVQVWTTIRQLDKKWFFWYYEAANNFVVLPTIQRFLVGYIQYAQNTVTVMMTVDRFLAICDVRLFQLWQRWVPVCALALFAASFVLHAILHFEVARVGSRFVYNIELEYYSLEAKSDEVTLKSSILGQAIVGTVCLVGCAVLNCRSMHRLRQLYMAHKRIELSFFTIAFFTFIAHAANVVILWFLVHVYFVHTDHKDAECITEAAIAREASVYALEAISLGPGILTLLVRGPIRRKFISTLKSILVALKCVTLKSPQTLFLVESSQR